MGIDTFQYLGAFAKVTPKISTTLKKIKTCSNPQCIVRDKFIDTAFCSKCGSKIIDSVIPDEYKWDWMNWSDENDFVDKLRSYTDDDHEFLFPNTSRSGAILVDLDDEDDTMYVQLGALPPNLVDPKPYIEAFKNEYSEILEKMKDDNIKFEIVFGYFKGWH